LASSTTSPLDTVRRTASTPAARSMSQRSSAIHSSGLKPVAAANVGSGRKRADSSAAIASSSVLA